VARELLPQQAPCQKRDGTFLASARKRSLRAGHEFQTRRNWHGTCFGKRRLWHDCGTRIALPQQEHGRFPIAKRILEDSWLHGWHYFCYDLCQRTGQLRFAANVERLIVYMWLTEILSELEREKNMRIYVFPRLQRDGKLTSAEAQLRLARLTAAIELVNVLRDAGVHQTDQLPIRLIPEPRLKAGAYSNCNPPIIKGGE
jgi:hypothetical protein